MRVVDDALGDQIGVFAGLRVEAVGVLILLDDLANDHRAVLARIDRDLAGRRRQRLAHDLDAGLLVVVLGADTLEVFGSTQQRNAAARQYAFLDGWPRRWINRLVLRSSIELCARRSQIPAKSLGKKRHSVAKTGIR